VVEELRGLLTAALKLAGLGGVHMIVQPPLSVEAMSPRSPTDSAIAAENKAIADPHERGRGSKVDTHSKVGQRAAEAHQPGELRPRPTRPLRADLPSVVLRRIMSYLIDIALQCTPQVMISLTS
jgi:hypothetical protein